MRQVQIGVLLVMGLCVTFTSAGYIRNRMVINKSSPSYSQQSQQQQSPPVKIEVEKESEEEESPEHLQQSHFPNLHSNSNTRLSTEIANLKPIHSKTFTTVRDGDHQITLTTRDRQKEMELEAIREAEEERVILEQNQNAKYFFASAVDDGIMDQSQVRQESRDGTKVKGSYSYSDGYVKRTINYEADEGGYRVISEESEPIGEGPQTDLINGKADVHTQVEGVDTQYSIKADDIVLPMSTLAPEVKIVKTSSVKVKSSQNRDLE